MHSIMQYNAKIYIQYNAKVYDNQSYTFLQFEVMFWLVKE